MGGELTGGEAFTACAALSSDVGVELAEGEALTACAGTAAAWTRAELGAATTVASPPSLTVARGRARERLRLLSAQASLRFLSPPASSRLPVVVQADLKVEASFCVR
jgi:hypothetical protein